MKRSSLLLAILLAIGLGACGEKQKPAPKAPITPPTELAKPKEAAPAPPPPPPAAEPAKPAAKDEMKK